MSGRLSRVAFTSGAVTLALVLLAPSAALACEKDGDGAGHSSGGSTQSSEHAKGEQGASGSEHGKQDSKRDAKGGKSDQSATGSGDGHNPPGNNGTIKIDYAAPADSGHANRPHPGCAFQLRMFNFDDDQYGSITFVGQAPTKLGTLLTQNHVLLSNDAAGGGQDVDEVYAYTAQQLGLIGKPQAKQGWHIKVSVDAENAPGGAKHKVFWLKCDEAPATGSSNGGTTTQGGTTTSTSTANGSTSSTATSTASNAVTTTKSTTTSSTQSAGTTAGAATAGTAPAAAAATTVTGGEAAAAAAPAAAPAAQPANRGSALPFTGSNLATMLVIALAALLAGGFAIRAGRRRTAGL